jgi:hypothetical protein
MGMSAFNTSKRKLLYAEEHILVDFIIASADHSMPLTPHNITVHANAIITG